MTDLYQQHTAELIRVVAEARERVLERVLRAGYDLKRCSIVTLPQPPRGLLCYEEVHYEGRLVATLEVVLDGSVFRIYGSAPGEVTDLSVSA